jgi:hypothetical protein
MLRVLRSPGRWCPSRTQPPRSPSHSIMVGKLSRISAVTGLPVHSACVHGAPPCMLPLPRNSIPPVASLCLQSLQNFRHWSLCSQMRGSRALDIPGRRPVLCLTTFPWCSLTHECLDGVGGRGGGGAAGRLLGIAPPARPSRQGRSVQGLIHGDWGPRTDDVSLQHGRVGSPCVSGRHAVVPVRGQGRGRAGLSSTHVQCKDDRPLCVRYTVWGGDG